MTVQPEFRECADKIGAHVRSLEGVRHPLTAPAALDRAADYVAAELARVGCRVIELPFIDHGRPYRNIIGTLPGKGEQSEQVIVMAHYDTVAGSPGADDNASGVAVLLEIAAKLALLSFERTILFVGVSLEENAHDGDHGSGTRGSRALAAHAREQGWEIAGVIVLESVAFAGEDVIQTAPPGVPITVPKTGNFLAVVGNERSEALVDGFSRTVCRLGSDLPHLALTVPGNGERLPDTRRSDHAPFWDAGFPAVMLTDTTNFRNPHYHRPSDTLETLNLGFAAQVCAVTAAFVAELARPAPQG